MEGRETNLRDAVQAAVKPFSLDENEFMTYLKVLNDIPAYDVVLNFQEVMLLFAQDKSESNLLETQISKVEEFGRQVSALPPESDDFWSNPYDDPRWSEITHSASELLAILAR